MLPSLCHAVYFTVIVAVSQLCHAVYFIMIVQCLSQAADYATWRVFYFNVALK